MKSFFFGKQWSYPVGAVGGLPIEQVGNGGHKLGGREWLGEKKAVRDALDRPLIGGGSGHVNDGKGRIHLAGGAGDFPAV